jgi:hypothetical protein
MVTEIDAGACFGDGPDILEDRLERFGRHQVGNERGDAAARCGGGLLGGILRHARAGDILAVSKVQVDIDDAGKHRQAGDVDALAGICCRAGREDGRELAVADREVACDRRGCRQQEIAAA